MEGMPNSFQINRYQDDSADWAYIDEDGYALFVAAQRWDSVDEAFENIRAVYNAVFDKSKQAPKIRTVKAELVVEREEDLNG